MTVANNSNGLISDQGGEIPGRHLDPCAHAGGSDVLYQAPSVPSVFSVPSIKSGNDMLFSVLVLTGISETRLLLPLIFCFSFNHHLLSLVMALSN